MTVVYPKEEGKQRMTDDGLAAYAHALQWVVTGEKAHADKTIEIYNAWSAMFTNIVAKNGDIYPSLYNSWNANGWMAGAEIIRYANDGAAGWAENDIKKFEEVLCSVFERLTLEWKGGAGSYGGLQNQTLSTVRTQLAIGVFLDDKALFDFAVGQLFEREFTNAGIVDRHGHGVNLVGLTVASDGEIMEFNRDAAHGTGSFNSLVNAAEILRHQDVDDEYDLYALMFEVDEDTVPRLLSGSEYAANSYINSPTSITDSANFVNEHGGIRYPEMVANYYRNIWAEPATLEMTDQIIDKFRPLAANGYDICWTTLTHADLSVGLEEEDDDDDDDDDDDGDDDDGDDDDDDDDDDDGDDGDDDDDDDDDGDDDDDDGNGDDDDEGSGDEGDSDDDGNGDEGDSDGDGDDGDNDGNGDEGDNDDDDGDGDGDGDSEEGDSVGKGDADSGESSCGCASSKSSAVPPPFLALAGVMCGLIVGPGRRHRRK
ncbi:MAG: alginate lyase family protein [Nannocystaceae bacterium]